MQSKLVIIFTLATLGLVCAAPVEKSSPIKCSKGDKQVNPGETFEDGDIVYNCSRSGEARAVACTKGGKRLNDGDQYEENGVSFECMIDVANKAVRVVACVQEAGGTKINRVLGCHWVDGEAPQQFDVQCQYDAAANTATKVQVKCNYNLNGGVYVIEPGCYRKVGDGVVGCVKSGNSLSYTTSTSGLNEC